MSATSGTLLSRHFRSILRPSSTRTVSEITKGNEDASGSVESMPKKKATKKDRSNPDKKIARREPSGDVLALSRRLYDDGYLNHANFFPNNRFDVARLGYAYGRQFVKCAAEKFGKDNHEIAEWLSGQYLKEVALFGCPSLARKSVYSAKRLRRYMGIREEIACNKCVLSPSCKYLYRDVCNGKAAKLDLVDVMRVITIYTLESTPAQLLVTDEVKASVSELLKQVLNLSKTIHRGPPVGYYTAAL